MKTTFEGTMQPLDTTIPDPALIVLIGAAGSGKSTWASTWPSTQVLELDQFRAMVSDEAGDQEATLSAVNVMHTVLEARLARKRTTVIDATNTEERVRAGLVQMARNYGVPTVAFLVSTPASVCVERQADRSPDRAVPEGVVRRQHAEAVAAFPQLREEGFDHVVFADNIHRLEPLLKRASDTRRRELGWDGGDGLGGLLLVRRTFGEQVLPLWRWRDNSPLAGGDRVGEIRLGPDRLVLALRTDVDGEGDVGFDLLVGCPYDDDCDAPAWQPVFSVTDLLKAHTSDTGLHPDAVCSVHGGPDDVDQEADDHDQDDDPGGRADLAEQFAAAVRECAAPPTVRTRTRSPRPISRPGMSGPTAALTVTSRSRAEAPASPRTAASSTPARATRAARSTSSYERPGRSHPFTEARMARKPVTLYIATPADGIIEMSREAGTPVNLSANVGKVIDFPVKRMCSGWFPASGSPRRGQRAGAPRRVKWSRSP